MKITEKIQHFFIFLYNYIVGDKPTAKVYHFFNNLIWSATAGVTASFLSMLSSSVFGRIAGPAIYGKYNSFMSFVGAVIPLIILGLNIGPIKLLSEKKGKDFVNSIISSSLLLWIVQGVTVIFLGFGALLLVGWSNNRWVLGLVAVVAILMSLENIFHGFLRGVDKIKIQGFFRVLEGISLLGSLLVLILVFKVDYFTSMIAAVIVGSLVFIVSSIIKLAPRLSAANRTVVSKLIRINQSLIMVTLATMVLNSEKYMISKFWGNYQLGMFSAYYLFSFILISSFQVMFINVFLPTIMRESKSVHYIEAKISKVLRYFFIVWVGADTLLLHLFFVFLGSNYTYSLSLAIIFAVTSFLFFVLNLYNVLIYSKDIKSSSRIYSAAIIVIICSIPLFRNNYSYLIFESMVLGGGIVLLKRRLKQIQFISQENIIGT